MHHGMCVTHMPWCMSGSLTRDGGENVPGILGATHNFPYLARGPWHNVAPSTKVDYKWHLFHNPVTRPNSWAMGCLLWVSFEILTVITKPHCKVWYNYHTVNYLKNTLNRHPIAHSRVWVMGSFMWGQVPGYRQIYNIRCTLEGN